jgi:type II secretory pathway pseudopilin PulG
MRNKNCPRSEHSKGGKKTNIGFTVLELLVVISIIGLLVSVILVVVANAREKSRDTKRVSDMRQMLTGLEVFFNTNHGYPSSSGGAPQNMTPGYVGTLPSAPLPADGICGNTNNYTNQPYNDYYYEATGTSNITNGLTVWSDYNYYFCLGKQAGDISPGTKTLTPKGLR